MWRANIQSMQLEALYRSPRPRRKSSINQPDLKGSADHAQQQQRGRRRGVAAVEQGRGGGQVAAGEDREGGHPKATIEATDSTLAAQFKLTSYNILLDGLESGVTKPRGRKMKWKDRLKHVAASILSCYSDIVCVQEINQKMFEDLNPLLPGYKSFIGTTGKADHGKKGKFAMNNAIYFKEDVFAIVPMVVELDRKKIPFEDISEPELVNNEHCYDWRCVAILLKHKESNKIFCFQTVHLPSGETEKDEDDRLTVLSSEVNFLYGLDKVKAQTKEPVFAHVVCGDFNSTNGLGYENKVHPYMQVKRYQNAVQQSFATYHDWTMACFDYIYVKARTNIQSVPYFDPADFPIPDESLSQGSDHKPLSVVMMF